MNSDAQPRAVLREERLADPVVVVKGDELGVAEQSGAHPDLAVTALPGSSLSTKNMMTDTPKSVTSMLSSRRATSSALVGPSHASGDHGQRGLTGWLPAGEAPLAATSSWPLTRSSGELGERGGASAVEGGRVGGVNENPCTDEATAA